MSLSPQALAALPGDALQATAAATAEALSPGAPEQFDLFTQVDIRAELAGIQAPTLVIARSDDRVVPLYLQQDLAARIPGARIAEVHSGHMLPIEQPGEWLKLITSFLDEVSA